jgi:hypothetical protein
MNKEKLTGFLIAMVLFALGFGGTLLNWQMVFDEGKYYPKMAFVGPFIGFLGLAMLVGPSTKAEEVVGDETATRRRKLRQRLALTTLAIGLIAAGLNLALMNGWIGDLME